MARVPGYLIVVRRDQPELYRELQASAAGDDLVQVIMDRRTRDRRVITRDMSLDRRRRADRRAAPDSSWLARGFLVARVYRPVRPKPGNGFHNCLELPSTSTLVR